MRPGSLRPVSAKAAAKAENKLSTRLSRGEKRNRKRIAEIAAVYDAAPALTALFHKHLADVGTTADGLLFRGIHNGQFSERTYCCVWRSTHRRADRG
jgi:hypothetical protein